MMNNKKEQNKSEYPKSMDGKWKGFPAYAVVSTKEQEEELKKQGYKVVDDK